MQGKMVTHPEKCTGCMLCQIWCSVIFKGIFNPLKSKIWIRRPETGKAEIKISKECNDCGLCVRYCPYGALGFSIYGEEQPQKGGE